MLSSADGQIRAAGAEGLFCGDVRFLSVLIATVDGRQPIAVGHRLDGAASATFVGVLPDLGDPIADPTVRLERRRTATPSGLREELRLVNDSRSPVQAELAVRAGVDMATMHDVKQGRRPAGSVPPTAAPAFTWTAAGRTTELRVDSPASVTRATSDDLTLAWLVDVPARSAMSVTISVEAKLGPDDLRFRAPTPHPAWDDAVSVRSVHPHLGRLEIGRAHV